MSDTGLFFGSGYGNYWYNPELKIMTVPFYFFLFLKQELAEGKQIL